MPDHSTLNIATLPELIAPGEVKPSPPTTEELSHLLRKAIKLKASDHPVVSVHGATAAIRRKAHAEEYTHGILSGKRGALRESLYWPMTVAAGGEEDLISATAAFALSTPESRGSAKMRLNIAAASLIKRYQRAIFSESTARDRDAWNEVDPQTLDNHENNLRYSEGIRLRLQRRQESRITARDDVMNLIERLDRAVEEYIPGAPSAADAVQQEQEMCIGQGI